MLSPHEIAALMLLNAAEDTSHLEPGDLNALISNQLVRRDWWAVGEGQVSLTCRGRRILDALGQGA